MFHSDGTDISQSEEKVKVPLPEGGDQWPHPHMELFRTKPDEVRDPSDIKCPGYTNENTAWWDGSQIYGSSEKATQALRTKLPDGKLTLDEIGAVSFLPWLPRQLVDWHGDAAHPFRLGAQCHM